MKKQVEWKARRVGWSKYLAKELTIKNIERCQK